MAASMDFGAIDFFLGTFVVSLSGDRLTRADAGQRQLRQINASRLHKPYRSFS